MSNDEKTLENVLEQAKIKEQIGQHLKIIKCEHGDVNLVLEVWGLVFAEVYNLSLGWKLSYNILSALSSLKAFEGIKEIYNINSNDSHSLVLATEHVDNKLRELNLLTEDEFKIWKPRRTQTYFSIESTGEIIKHCNHNSFEDIKIIENGRYYEDMATVTDEVKRDKAIQKIKEWTTRENGDWIINWEDREQFKYFVRYDGRLVVDWCRHKINPDEFIYVRNKEIATTMINKLEEELKLYWRKNLWTD